MAFRHAAGGAQDVTSCWDADNYPEIWLDQIIAQDRAVDLPIVTHPVGGAKPPFILGSLSGRR